MLGLSPAGVGSARETPTTPVVDYYRKLGVPTIINAAGTYTYLTASLMPPEVQAAVAGAAHHPCAFVICRTRPVPASHSD
jgi:L-seryl-tRNA(Ser) seleniumtransferase